MATMTAAGVSPAMAQKTGERRAQRRYAARHTVTVSVTYADRTKEEAPGAIIDVSASGVAVECDLAIRIGTEIQIDFAPGSARSVKVTAIIRNCRNDIYGVEFQPHDQSECDNLDWARGLLLPAVFHVDPVLRPTRRVGAAPAVIAASLISCAGFYLHHGMTGVIVASGAGALLTFAAYTM